MLQWGRKSIHRHKGDLYEILSRLQRGTPLYNLIKENHIPFYVDRIAGGITYYPYQFDQSLIAAYRELLCDDFLASSCMNRRPTAAGQNGRA